jgi:hypothetical protein
MSCRGQFAGTVVGTDVVVDVRTDVVVDVGTTDVVVDVGTTDIVMDVGIDVVMDAGTDDVVCVDVDVVEDPEPQAAKANSAAIKAKVNNTLPACSAILFII